LPDDRRQPTALRGRAATSFHDVVVGLGYIRCGMENRIFDRLNDEQAAAVAAVRGPVCILAGAGTGKTTTITRRIANQVFTRTFSTDEILAVTFTEKAAKEMGSRLASLGTRGVRARTFHAEALAQYRHFSGDASEILGSKGQILAQLVARLPMPYRFMPLRDVATEIEWAKNSRIASSEYRARLGDHEPPIPEDLMAGVYAAYERRKERGGLIDFEDLLERTVVLLSEDERALNVVRSRYRAFTVDEYQDVNLLQQALLDAWVGERPDLCVVGDDYQAIFGFTGATPRHLLSFPSRYPTCHEFRLTANYRSTPEVLEVANRLVPRLGGSAKTLRPLRNPGPAPIWREHSTGEQEIEWMIAQMRELHRTGLGWEQIAVLYRINGRSEELEEAFAAGGIPYQVRDGAFLRRPAARSVIARLKRASSSRVAEAVEKLASSLGWVAEPREDEEFEGDEATRQADLTRLVRLAREYPGEGGVGGFLADLTRRFATEEQGRGVQILTYHRAKGLEFDAVFLPRLEDKELPFALSRTDDEVAEERRLLYVGITRAKEHLFVSWALRREAERRKSPRPSPFLTEIKPPRAAGVSAESPAARPQTTAVRASVDDQHVALFVALKDWRLRRAREGEVPAYVVFNDSTLARIAELRPSEPRDLLAISGVGPAKLERYGDDVIELVRAHAS
jgi:DNA helicase-2/ATP-dependent DNA helicase PcrA